MINKKLKCKIFGTRGTWQDVYRACLNTIGKETTNNPSSEWKRRILISEHSPIRKLSIQAKWYNLWYWVSTHFVRHKIGIEHFISTQRTDRCKEDRNSKPQDSEVMHETDADAQAIINISRKRLCHCASPETTEAWKLYLDEVKKIEPELVSVCVKECVYRNGLCPEFYTCGYNKSNSFEKELKEYTKCMENQINDKTNINK